MFFILWIFCMISFLVGIDQLAKICKKNQNLAHVDYSSPTIGLKYWGIPRGTVGYHTFQSPSLYHQAPILQVLCHTSLKSSVKSPLSSYSKSVNGSKKQHASSFLHIIPIFVLPKFAWLTTPHSIPLSVLFFYTILHLNSKPYDPWSIAS